MLHHLSQLLDNSLVSFDLVLFILLFLLGLVYDGATLLRHHTGSVHEGAGVPVGLVADAGSHTVIALQLASSSRGSTLSSPAKGAVSAPPNRFQRAIKTVKIELFTILICLMLRYEALHIANLVIHFLVLLLLKNQILHKQFAIVALRLVLTLEFPVFLAESSVLVVNTLSDVCD
jgi:hypothetical protein